VQPITGLLPPTNAQCRNAHWDSPGAASLALTPRRAACYVLAVFGSDPINKNTTLVTRALLLLLACLGVVACTTPPVQEMSDARQAIAAAEQANGAKLAPESLNDAQRFLADAERQIQQEAYGQARMNAVRAKNRASQALHSIQSTAEQGAPH
jgi:hypothetical protein